ncbi:MAG: cupin domain-containing protein [Lysobacterales bacterium]|nr:MAG: cupin domain-containing protein [Xanthomonadales bacterium]
MLALAGFALLHTGLARMAFFELFAYVKGVDILGPTVVRERPTDSPYQRWLETARAEIPVFEGLVIEDVASIALRPWPQMGAGVTGLYLRFADYQINDGRLLEIPAGGSTVSQRHLYEKGVYVIGGSGYTVFQQEGKAADRVEWGPGDLFSVPLNVRHQHFSGGDGPARLLAITSFPLVLNVMADEHFVADNPYVFDERYDGAPDYFDAVENNHDIMFAANYIEDIRKSGLQPYEYRGEGNTTIRWFMAGNSMLSLHVSEMPPRNYMKAHRHSSDAFILFLSGDGFSLTWPEGAYHKRQRIDWKNGTLFVPPTYWYHQHLNTGETPARHLAINSPALVKNLGLRFSDQLDVDVDGFEEEWRRELAKQQREGG